jgi:hypothetical protein
MVRMILCVVIALTSLLAMPEVVMGFPRPAPVSTRPEISFRPDALRMYRHSDGQHYWYFIYDVVNSTGTDRVWAPSMVLYTDRGEVLTDGRYVPRSVQEGIRGYVGDPLLESKVSIIGTLRQGAGHARRGVAVWPAKRTDVNELRLFVGGISPESTSVLHPATGEPVTLRKTLYRHYLIPGDAAARGDTVIDLHPDYVGEDHWVFR